MARLIDANALLEAIKFEHDRIMQDLEVSNNMKWCEAVCNHRATEAIERSPTVEDVEVVRGRWIIEKRHTVSRNPYMDDNYHAHATCSECGFCIHSENASFGYPKMNTTNYCPNCGADMRERKDNE